MSQTEETFNAYKHLFKPVPLEGQPNVCYLCLGAVGDFPQCYNCRKLFLESACPTSLERRVIPMTIARNPSPWYWTLQTYKGAQFAENALVIASIAYQWLKQHKSKTASLLGGDADFLSIVPSKKPGITYERQPLQRALSLVQPFGDRLRKTLRCVDATLGGHMKYAPEMFEPVDAAALERSRIILIEDTWITGATALSAAGALLAAGAESVVITPIARDFRIAFHTEEHPYNSYIAEPYELDRWPRL